MADNLAMLQVHQQAELSMPTTASRKRRNHSDAADTGSTGNSNTTTAYTTTNTNTTTPTTTAPTTTAPTTTTPTPPSEESAEPKFLFRSDSDLTSPIASTSTNCMTTPISSPSTPRSKVALQFCGLELVPDCNASLTGDSSISAQQQQHSNGVSSFSIADTTTKNTIANNSFNNCNSNSSSSSNSNSNINIISNTIPTNHADSAYNSLAMRKRARASSNDVTITSNSDPNIVNGHADHDYNSNNDNNNSNSSNSSNNNNKPTMDVPAVAVPGLEDVAKPAAARRRPSLQRALPSINRFGSSKPSTRSNSSTSIAKSKKPSMAAPKKTTTTTPSNAPISPPITPDTEPTTPLDATLDATSSTPVAHISDPIRASLTWHDDEITVFDPNDSDDDGLGFDGIGFEPTPLQAQARATKRAHQLSEYRRREEADARDRRSQRRAARGKCEEVVDDAKRAVHFMEVDVSPVAIVS